ncbi:hypothetical protein V8C86DRAFT_3082190 [Haematococcus lacustris]
MAAPGQGRREAFALYCDADNADVAGHSSSNGMDLDLIRQASHDPRVQALRRRDRVWSRLYARALQEQPRAPPNPREQ